jgi:hypothetical protein
MNNVFKNVVKNAVGALAIAGVMAVAQAQTASALSLNFTPTGTDLDGQGGPDIATTVGSVLSFDLILNTNGLQSDKKISSVEYILDWDSTELSLYGFTPLGEILGGAVNLTNPDPANVFTTYGIVQSLASSIAPNISKKIGTIQFEVLNGLNNSGNPDFYLTYLFPAFSGVEGSQTQSVEVQGTAVPTPALLPGIFALGATAIRKRKQAAAV